MNTNTHIPTWFRIAAVAAVAWNVLGVAAYLMEVTMSEAALAALPEAERLLYEQMPPWVTAAFAIAVWSGLAGSIALALRRGIALPLLSASLAAVLAQMGYLFLVAGVATVKGAASTVMPAVIVLIAVALVWLAARVRQRGWIAGTASA
jgi:hypothetical protein